MFTMASSGDAGSSSSIITPTLSGRAAAPTSFTWPASGSLPAATAPTSDSASLPLGDLSSVSGFASVPPKVIKKIVGKEYIDIRELLPETWQVESENPSCCHSKRPRRSLITEFNVWAEGYATMAVILLTAYPAKAAHFFAYLRTITKASRTFEGSAWASYDMVYCRQAANRGSLDWGLVDTVLYSEAFTG